MPYLSKKLRKQFKDFEAALNTTPIISPGELNYMITRLLLKYVNDWGHNKNYALYNSAMGALESAKQEFYRRAVAPYEDEKIKEHGDVY